MYRTVNVDYNDSKPGWKVWLESMEIGPLSDVTNPDLKANHYLIEDFSAIVNNEKDIIGYVGALGVIASVENDGEKRELVLADRVHRFYEKMLKTSYGGGRSIIKSAVEKFTEKYRTVEEMDKNFRNMVDDVSERVSKQYPKLQELWVGKNTIRRAVQIKVIEEMSKKSSPDPSDAS